MIRFAFFVGVVLVLGGDARSQTGRLPDEVVLDLLKNHAVLDNKGRGPYLVEISISDSNKEAIALLPSLKKLATIGFGGQIDANTAAKIAAVEQLTDLRISDPSKETLKHVVAMSRLKSLTISHLARNPPDAEHYKAVASMSGLRHLAIRNSKIREGTIEAIHKMDGLEKLDIEGCVWLRSDEAFPFLNKMTNLKSLNIRGIAASSFDREQLHQSLPECRIQE